MKYVDSVLDLIQIVFIKQTQVLYLPEKNCVYFRHARLCNMHVKHCLHIIPVPTNNVTAWTWSSVKISAGQPKDRGFKSRKNL